jgi:hypothetical protein
MKTSDILTRMDKVIQYFINNDENQPNTEFCKKIDMLINLKAEIANGIEQGESTCNLQNVTQRSELLFDFIQKYNQRQTSWDSIVDSDNVELYLKGKL